MEIKKELSECNSNSHIDSFSDHNEVKPNIYYPNVVPKTEQVEVTSSTSSTLSTNMKWSPGRWQDGTRKSAFQPYKPITKCTVLTNLQRGNTQAETPVPQDADVNFHSRAGQGEITLLDINNEPSVDVLDNNGLTALHWASAYGQMMAVTLLLNNGAKVNYVGSEGETPLLLAAAGGHHDVVRILLNEGAHVNYRDEVGNTALMYSAFSDHPHCCNELLVRGADITISNETGDTAFSLAINNKSTLAQAVIENYLTTLLTAQ